jgi:hypothetical protein
MTIEEARKGLVINRASLDTECERLPYIFWEVSKEYSEAVDTRDTLKHDADKMWGSLYITFKKTKVSDKTAESMADSDEGYSSLYKDFLDAKKITDDWNSMKEAYEKKTVMLREMCGLIASGYYSSITVKEETKDKIYEARKIANMG